MASRTVFALVLILAAHFSAVARAGLLWPAPQSAALGASALSVDALDFAFSVAGADGGLLRGALARYAALLFVRAPPTEPLNASLVPVVGALRALAVDVRSPDETLGPATSENYTLEVAAGAAPGADGSATLAADTVYGAIRGLETFTQLVDFVGPLGSAFVVRTAAVADFPRFAHRGALIDTSRHFEPVAAIKAFLDAMSYTKLNVLHWHVTDDESFPYFSAAFPNLSAAGAYNAPDPAHVYSRADVQGVIAYARARGIRVVAEFDSPGHSRSWGLGQPGLLTQCYSNASGTPEPVPGSFGPVDPTQPATWDFLRAFFAEVAASFPDAYIHAGGDEVDYSCWQSNPRIAAWMSANGVATFAALESYYVQRVIDLLDGLGKSVVGWQEIFDNGLSLPNSTVVHIWKGSGNWSHDAEELSRVTAGGFRALFSADWYVSRIDFGPQWHAFYEIDPTNFSGTDAQKALVIGGELAAWGEFIDAANFVSRVFPFGCAIAERLWSPSSVTNVTAAAPRLHAHRCRMLTRGLPAQVESGPSFCPVELSVSYSPPWGPE